MARTKNVGAPNSSRKSTGGAKRKAPQKALEFDPQRFKDLKSFEAYTDITDCKFIKERPIVLEEGEYEEFSAEIHQRRWDRLSLPDSYFDLDIIREFYANAIGDQCVNIRKESNVRGQVIIFDCDAINALLGHSIEENRDLVDCQYQGRMEVVGVNDNDPLDIEIAQLLCLPGRSFERNAYYHVVRIYRKDIRSISQMWAVLILANLYPTGHVSDVVMPMAHLIYSILTRVVIDVSRSSLT